MDTNGFYKDVTKGLAVLASSLKQTLEEVNEIEPEQPSTDTVEIHDQSQIIEENSSKTEN